MGCSLTESSDRVRAYPSPRGKNPLAAERKIGSCVLFVEAACVSVLCALHGFKDTDGIIPSPYRLVVQYVLGSSLTL